MRFHIGFSKRISFKWLLLILGGLLAFFGIDKVHAETLNAVPNNVYVKSPQVDQEYAYAGDLINAETGTPYSANWDGENYYAFQTITSPYTSLGRGDNIRGARLRWTYPTAQMNKCSSGQYVTYTFEFYLRKLYSTDTIWSKGFNGMANHNVWIRSSSQNYDCTVSSVGVSTMKASCTMPNPSSNVYFYLDNFSIPSNGWYQTNGNNMYYNVGVRSITYTCTGVDSGAIMNNQNQNTQDIMNNQNQNTQDIMENNNQNTQNITNSIDDLTGVVNDTSVPDYEDLPQFIIENMAISSQSQKLFMLPIQLLNAVISGSESCSPLRIDLSSITHLGGGGSYILEIPCMGQRIKDYVGWTWYDIFDYIMAAIVFYYVGTNIVLRIQQIMSGVDTLPSYYTSHGKTKTALVDSETGEVIGNG